MILAHDANPDGSNFRKGQVNGSHERNGTVSRLLSESIAAAREEYKSLGIRGKTDIVDLGPIVARFYDGVLKKPPPKHF
jgi:hypothetical protein